MSNTSMSSVSTIYKLSLVALFYFVQGYGSTCPVLECWLVQERRGGGGGFPADMSQEMSLLHVRTVPNDQEERHVRTVPNDQEERHVRTDPNDQEAHRQQLTPAEVKPERVYYITDPAATLCHSSLLPPRGSAQKPQCEISPFLPQPSSVRWAASLTDSALSPVYLQADWFSAALRGLDGQLVLSSVLRAATATKELNVILSVSSRTVSVRSRLGEPTRLDCRFWVDASSPLSRSGFAVEWRYQSRGDSRLILAYDGKADRLLEDRERGASLDLTAAREEGNVSLLLQEVTVRHAGTYVCTVFLPHLQAQVTVDLEVVEVNSPSIEDSMAMVAVAFALYGLIQVVSLTFTSSDYADKQEKKEK